MFRDIFKKRIAQAKYNKTPKGRATWQRWYKKNKLAETTEQARVRKAKAVIATTKYRKTEMGKVNAKWAAKRAYEKRYSTDEGPRYQRKAMLKQRHGLTVEAYAALLEAQNFVCAICHKAEKLKGRHLYVDHSHTTNRIRGLLCMKCNLLLGHAEDNIERMEAAIEYLKEKSF